MFVANAMKSLMTREQLEKAAADWYDSQDDVVVTCAPGEANFDALFAEMPREQQESVIASFVAACQTLKVSFIDYDGEEDD